MRIRPPGRRTPAFGALFLAAAIGGFFLSGLGGVALGFHADTTTDKHTDTGHRTTTPSGGSTSTSGETTSVCPPGTAPDEFGDCVDTTGTETEPSGPPDLEIFKEGPAAVQSGQVMVFRLSVDATNTSLPPGIVVTVTELVPAGTTLRGVGGSGWVCAPPPPRNGPSSIRCTYAVGDAELSVTPTLTVLERANSAGRVQSCASVTGKLGVLPVDDPDLTNNRACIFVAISPAATTTIGGTGPLPPPQPSVSVNVTSGPGTTLVRLPGRKSFAILHGGAQIPVGSEIDVTGGLVELTSAEGAAQFSKGRFLATEPRAATTVRVTNLVLTGGDFSGCLFAFKRAPASVSQTPGKTVRRLWGKGKGRFRTTGKYAAATVRGTSWRITDRCDGTLTQVLTGRVSVFDLKRKRTVLVTAGHSYLVSR